MPIIDTTRMSKETGNSFHRMIKETDTSLCSISSEVDAVDPLTTIVSDYPVLDLPKASCRKIADPSVRCLFELEPDRLRRILLISPELELELSRSIEDWKKLFADDRVDASEGRLRWMFQGDRKFICVTVIHSAAQLGWQVEKFGECRIGV